MAYLRARLLLRVAVLTLIGFTGLAFLGLATWPLAAFAPHDDVPAPQVKTTQPPIVADFSADELAALCNRALQIPVVDKPVPEVADEPVLPIPAKSPPKLPIELLGTALDQTENQSRAWIRIEGGREEMVRVGDAIPKLAPPTTVKSIHAKHIVLSAEGFDLEYRFD